MVTDNIESTTITVSDGTDVSVKQETVQETVIDSKINELMVKFNEKCEEIESNYKKKLESIQTDYDKIKKENDDLRKTNANLILNTSHGSNTIEDFSTVEFSDVDWDEQATKYMSGIDTKINS